MFTVAVIGCGVIGLSTAVAIQRQLGPKVKVVIFTEKVSPQTTGDVAPAIWCPALLEDTPEYMIHKWAKVTKDHIVQLWKNGEAREAGVTFLPTLILSDDEDYQLPIWLKMSLGYSELSEERVKYYSERYHQRFTGGFVFATFTLQQSKFLPYLQRKFVEDGGEVRMRHIDKIEELSDFDVIVNCTGVYSRTLVPDSSVYPIRGQVARVKAPWQFHGLLIGSLDEVVPNQEWVGLGRTYQMNNFNTEVDEEDTRDILNRCYKLVPSLQNAPIVEQLVGLRPARNQVRLELEYRRIGDKTVKIVHNYGHGRNGITLSAGCALDAAQLVKETLSQSKL